ncbi:hypothetical protein Sgou_00020 [Streptomyces gougerotii]|uniref:tRNA methyltransferase TRMD/TRM10-type domain-containing protein n=1 Tax=Streptomyces gougerotii TaxID=53448 RepID=A0ABQ1CYE1_9ACTN|nr:hypothetical protein Sgou_00020 [Streptomyces gougerotii]
MRLDAVTIFPEYLDPLNVSLVGKARTRGVLDVRVHDLREWTYDRHNTVDDTPYGGGPGMVMKTEPWGEALGPDPRRRVRGRGAQPRPGRPHAQRPPLRPGSRGRTLRRALADLHTPPVTRASTGA